MDKLFDYIAKEWKMISQAPFALLVLLAIMFSAAYIAVKWRYSFAIEQVIASNDRLTERLYQKYEQAETFKKRAFKCNETVLEVVDSSKWTLKERSLSFVKNLREFIERYRREDQAIQEKEWSKIVLARNDDEKRKLWQKYTAASSRLWNQRNSEYERRFKVDAVLLRDELLEKLKQYKRTDSFHESVYEYPTNYFGFNDVAGDIEIMAKVLSHSLNQAKTKNVLHGCL